MMAASDDVTNLPLFVSPTPDYGVGEYAARAADTDRGESLLAMCERAADAILDVQGTVTAWEIRIALQRIGKLDGTERLDALGGLLGRRMKLVGLEYERPPKDAAKELPKTHQHLYRRYRRPTTHEERAARMAEGTE